MRNIKYLVVFVAGLLALSSCDQNDTEGVLYHAKNSEASFVSSSSSYPFGEFDPDKFEITVKRGNANGAASVPISANDASGNFTISNADFADGAYETQVAITFDRNNLVTGKTYSISLTLPDNPINERLVEHAVSIMRDYIWRPYVTGTFSSAFFEQEWPVKMEKAEGADAYRLLDVYETGYHIGLVVDGAKMTPLAAPTASTGYYPFSTGVVDSQYGLITIRINAESDKTYFNLDAKKLGIYGQFTVSAGSFGWAPESFTW